MNELNMQVIINIQLISKALGDEIRFDELENKSYEELADIQEKILPLYNAQVNKEK